MKASSSTERYNRLLDIVKTVAETLVPVILQGPGDSRLAEYSDLLQDALAQSVNSGQTTILQAAIHSTRHAVERAKLYYDDFGTDYPDWNSILLSVDRQFGPLDVLAYFAEIPPQQATSYHFNKYEPLIERAARESINAAKAVIARFQAKQSDPDRYVWYDVSPEVQERLELNLISGIADLDRLMAPKSSGVVVKRRPAAPAGPYQKHYELANALLRTLLPAYLQTFHTADLDTQVQFWRSTPVIDPNSDLGPPQQTARDLMSILLPMLVSNAAAYAPYDALLQIGRLRSEPKTQAVILEGLQIVAEVLVNAALTRLNYGTLSANEYDTLNTALNAVRTLLRKYGLEIEIRAEVEVTRKVTATPAQMIKAVQALRVHAAAPCLYLLRNELFSNTPTGYANISTRWFRNLRAESLDTARTSLPAEYEAVHNVAAEMAALAAEVAEPATPALKLITTLLQDLMRAYEHVWCFTRLQQPPESWAKVASTPRFRTRAGYRLTQHKCLPEDARAFVMLRATSMDAYDQAIGLHAEFYKSEFITVAATCARTAIEVVSNAPPSLELRSFKEKLRLTLKALQDAGVQAPGYLRSNRTRSSRNGTQMDRTRHPTRPRGYRRLFLLP